MPRSKKREGLVVKATNTTLSRIIVIHEFYYVFLSVSDLSQYVSTWPSKITARLSREMAVFSRAVFQVAQRVTSGSPVKTVVFSTRLKLSESANFNGILIKFKPLNQVA